MKRNDFLKKALAGTAALFAVNWGTLAEIREYKHPDKPLLTEANLNRFFSNLELRRSDGSLEEAMTDTKAFLDKNFSISPQQKLTIERMTVADWENIKSIVTDARDQKGLLQFKFENVRRAECRTNMMLVKQNVQNLSNKKLEIRKYVIQ